VHISSNSIIKFHKESPPFYLFVLSYYFEKKEKKNCYYKHRQKRNEREREKRNNTHIQIKRERERKGKINTVTYKDTKVKSNYWIRLILMMERKEMKRQGETKGFQYMLILKFLFESSKS